LRIESWIFINPSFSAAGTAQSIIEKAAAIAAFLTKEALFFVYVNFL